LDKIYAMYPVFCALNYSLELSDFPLKNDLFKKYI